MNPHLLPPLFLAACTGLLCPGLLVRARWARRAPGLALAAWGTLAVGFVFALALEGTHLVLSRDQMLSSTAAVATVLFALPVVAFCVELLGARRRRARHADTLRLVGRKDPGLGVTVLAHGEPAVYCLPGRAPQIVVTTGAMSLLTDEQLAATLEHERAHIGGRHHLVSAAAEGFSRIFPGLPLSRRARAEVPLLLEMAADRRALRSSTHEVLATALYSMASARPEVADRVAFGVGGTSVVLRIQHILHDRDRADRPVARGLLTLGTAFGVLLSVVLTCCGVSC
ncbi:M56 family metallopeptidase [Streptomyces sp. NRRL_ISP-5395]|uniref:M56 family metallopeptidase n=1 Tax=Streptomyces TaxID=1883 RepID=UPI00187375D5|nr:MULTISPECIES: M56 family metallopeptidase [Streptomyces]MCX4707249.1 M56 family metallopeptidase [Streptomyces griseus]MDX2670816.1 M56 family metallopeptidase [Streptomyces sp. NRRL_ISP-5395]GHF67582.1 hypothetical protein GCM10010504_40070 [Streptomyces griseus]